MQYGITKVWPRRRSSILHFSLHVLHFAFSQTAIRALAIAFALQSALVASAAPPHRYLYVASPGVRDLLEYGGHGVLVFDIDHDHKFLRRIASKGINENGKPLNVKGICASEKTGRLYVSTLRFLTCYDIATGNILWEHDYPGGCDRMAISPDGKIIYLPSLEGPHWNVVDAISGDLIKQVVTDSGSHNTIFSPDGKYVFLAGLRSPEVSVADASKHEVVRKVGPFSAAVRPFTINRAGTKLFACVNERLGFEVGDIETGKVLATVDVAGFEKGKPKRHGCPSHGIGLTPDESELWVTDAVNQRLHIYDAEKVPPVKKGEPIMLRDEPGWVTFSIDGQYAYPSTGEVIDTRTRKIVAQLRDETGRDVQSEKMLEIDLDSDGRIIETGNQFGVGAR
jgi:DNA-binding beta-propeller fold protein YncE